MKRYPICLIALMMMLSCHEDSDVVITIIENPDPPTVLITTRLVSVVPPSTIAADHPVQSFGGQSSSFDVIPYAQIKGTGIDRDYEIIRLTTSSNLRFFKTQSLVQNDVNYTHHAIPAVSRYPGHTSSDETFSLAPDATLMIPANSLTYPDGSIYQGPYEAVLASLNPTTDDASNIPSYTGISKTNKEVSLAFEACYYIAFIAGDGSPLKTTDASHISIPASTADQSWSFNSEKGIWASTGTSTDQTIIPLNGSSYYASASAKPMTRVTGTLTINGSPTPHYPIRITYAGQQRLIYTTNNGAWALQLPSETECTAHISFPCGDEQQATISTTSDAEQEFPIQVIADEIENALILGTTRDCDNNDVSNQLAILEGTNKSVIFSADPDIRFHIPICKNSGISISSLNMADGQSGPVINWKAADTINIYSSFACTQAREEYLSLTVSGEKKMYWNLLTSLLPGDRLLIADDGNEPDLDFDVFVEGMAEGGYQDNMLNILFEDKHLGSKGYSSIVQLHQQVVDLLHLQSHIFQGSQGQWIRGHLKAPSGSRLLIPSLQDIDQS
ncbi:MAG: hypothetical protein IPL92_04260 [Saprospiraceae bacterium]|nr:hypothetical protein [Candidatus Opimibacter iunctus]